MLALVVSTSNTEYTDVEKEGITIRDMHGNAQNPAVRKRLIGFIFILGLK